MYYQHFGLSGPPFQFTPTADVLYLSREHREALAFMEWSVLHEPTGLAVLIGESGVGKTTLICSVIARYRDTVEIALVTNPRLSFDQMLTLVLAQLGVTAGGLDKFAMIQRLMRLLEDRAADSCVQRSYWTRRRSLATKPSQNCACSPIKGWRQGYDCGSFSSVNRSCWNG